MPRQHQDKWSPDPSFLRNYSFNIKFKGKSMYKKVYLNTEAKSVTSCMYIGANFN